MGPSHGGPEGRLLGAASQSCARCRLRGSGDTVTGEAAADLEGGLVLGKRVLILEGVPGPLLWPEGQMSKTPGRTHPSSPNHSGAGMTPREVDLCAGPSGCRAPQAPGNPASEVRVTVELTCLRAVQEGSF